MRPANETSFGQRAKGSTDIQFFDGVRTSHEVHKYEEIPYETIAEMVDKKAIEEFRSRGMRPEKPITKVGAQNGDVYFQGRETVNKYYMAVGDIVQAKMDQIAKVTGRQYHLFDYVGAPDATDVIVAMGSGCEAIEETIDYLNANRGTKYGLVKVRLYRPFYADKFLAALPKTVKRIAVLDRMASLYTQSLESARGLPAHRAWCLHVASLYTQSLESARGPMSQLFA